MPEEAITVEQALRAFTLHAAYASFDEDRKGSITPGKLADLVVLGEDPTVIDPTQLRHVPVEATMIDGVFVYGDPG